MSLNAKITLLMCDVLEYYYRKDMEREKEEAERRRRSRKGKLWERSWIAQRNKFGASNTLLSKLSTEDQKSYRNFLRITQSNFDELLSLLDPGLQRADTCMREALPLSLKLEVTLRYLATGDSFASLSYLFRVPPGSISKFLPEILSDLRNKLRSFRKVPHTQEDWTEIGRKFQKRWNFPRCGGALDGKHIRIQCPPCTGSEFYNYKGFFSIILFALVDAEYNFSYVSIGANGRAGDAGIWHKCSLRAGLENGSLNLPNCHTIVGDDIFSLKTYLLKPYSRRNLSKKERIFNYRLSQARQISENAFGILAWQFCMFQRPIETKLETTDLIVWTACLLHNWLRRINPGNTISLADYKDPDSGNIIPGTWRENSFRFQSVSRLTSNNYLVDAERICNKYAEYFMNEGAIPWQWSKACVSQYSEDKEPQVEEESAAEDEDI